jgi:hypothetical protein
MLTTRSLRIALVMAFAVAANGTSHRASAGSSYERACWSAELSTISHNVSGTATIVDDVTIQVDDFFYDGGGPLVYFYLGATNSGSSFANGLEVPPLLSGTAYNGESLTLTLPPGETLDGYGAISVWCAEFNVNFGSGSFDPEPTPGNIDGDCEIDLDDYAAFSTCLAGPDVTTPPPGCPLADFEKADMDGDSDADLDDFAWFQEAFTG